MYLRKIKRSNGEVSVVLVESYRKNGKIKQRTIKYLGTESSLIKDNPNAIEELKKYYASLPKREMEVTLRLNLKEKISESNIILNYGYFWLEKFFNQLGLPLICKHITSSTGIKYNLLDILRLLVFSRCLIPDSKKSTYLTRDKFVEDFDIKLEDIYKSLDILYEYRRDIISTIGKNIREKYDLDTSITYYDVTNYFFEIDEPDDLRKKGVSKEHSPNPIVQMGLFIDKSGIPLDFSLFSGNTPDCSTLCSSFTQLKEQYKSERIILTADKGICTTDNLGLILRDNNGYIVSMKLRNSSEEFISKVLEESGYVYNREQTFKIKSFTREIQVPISETKTINHKQKVVCIWSSKYEVKERAEREKLLEKVLEMIKTPSKYTSKKHKCLKKYIKEEIIDKKTNKKMKGTKSVLHLNEEKIREDERLDGYYVIVTSEIELEDEVVLEKYRGLWKIEQSFKVLKTDLQGRPVYVRTPKHIYSHFLICFIALVLVRIIEKKLNNRYSPELIKSGLNSAVIVKMVKGFYLLNKRDQMFEELEKEFNLVLDTQYIKEEDFENYHRKVIR